MSDCLFCKIAEGQIPSNKVYEDEVCYAFYDIDPQAHPLSGDSQDAHRLGGRGHGGQRRRGGPHVCRHLQSHQGAGSGELPGGVQHRRAGGPECAAPALPRAVRSGHDLASRLSRACSPIPPRSGGGALRRTSVFAAGENLGAGRIYFARAWKSTGPQRPRAVFGRSRRGSLCRTCTSTCCPAGT